MGRDGYVRNALDTAGQREWLAAAIALVQAHRDELDALNVFPVADHDTGSNVLATLRVVLAESPVAASRNARGNSGLIIAEWLRGILRASAGKMTAETLRSGLKRGEQRAYAAVAHPVEGTALSVAAAAAGVHPDDESLRGVAQAAALAAGQELILTKDWLPELRKAGVVDAGGRALCLVLDALVATITGREPVSLPLLKPPARSLPTLGAGRFEVTYTLEADEIETLRERLAELGDSVVAADVGPREWAVHVHVADAGAAIEAALEVGRPRQIRIEALPSDGSVRLLVAIGLDPAVGALLAAEKVQLLGTGAAVELRSVAKGATSVLVLAPALSDETAGMAEELSGAILELRRQGFEAALLPIRSPVQAMAAVAVHDPAAEFSDAVVAMAEAAAATHYGEVRISDSAAQTSAGPCVEGDALGLAGGDVVLIGAEPATVAGELLDRMLATSGELVTLVGGPLVAVVQRHLAAAHPTVEVQAHVGSGPGLLIGVE
ncbi:MAG TPA: DAK2 domain-containing protein [Mycobacteriales bacterium]|jgi:hypothetical protein|nr:DAK2 domain-containing protein [Mycobacteriales bacterium]